MLAAGQRGAWGKYGEVLSFCVDLYKACSRIEKSKIWLSRNTQMIRKQ